jgi:hypothetical protein
MGSRLDLGMGTKSLTAMCASWMLFALFIGKPVAAEPVRLVESGPAASVMTPQQRDLYETGMSAAAKERWGEAHAAWLAAWGLKRHYQIAGSLGTAEAKLGRYRDAAEHLASFMREAPATKVKERQSVQELLAEVRKHVGALGIKVEPAGAEVFVDGVRVGKAPLADEVFVDAGARVIEARLEGYEIASAKVDAAAGASREVALRLVKSEGKDGAAARGATDNGSSPGAGNTGSSTAAGKREGQAGAGGDATTSIISGEAPAASGRGGPSKGLLVAGAAVSATALGAGILFTAVSNGKASDAAIVSSELARDNVRCPSTVFSAQCDEVLRLEKGRVLFSNFAVWTIVAGVAVGGATAVYALAAPKMAPKSSVTIVPAVGQGTGGLVLTGVW